MSEQCTNCGNNLLPNACTKLVYKASVNSGSGSSLKYLLRSPATAWMSVSKLGNHLSLQVVYRNGQPNNNQTQCFHCFNEAIKEPHPPKTSGTAYFDKLQLSTCCLVGYLSFPNPLYETLCSKNPLCMTTIPTYLCQRPA